jgi:REP element-mobilizing transposase RayT
MDRFYRRHLPHWVPEGRAIFITWNLKGALPKAALERLARARQAWKREAERRDAMKSQPPDESRGGTGDKMGDKTEDETENETGDETKDTLLRNLFRITEEYLDAAREGPRWLGEENCARIVNDTILEGSGQWYDLFAHVVMANHIHVLLRPRVDLERITRGIKMKTARQINRLLGRRGRPFWQDESFDHWIRTPERFTKAIRYIENNPVKAGFCAAPEDWRWSSEAMRERWEVGTAFRRSGL